MNLFLLQIKMYKITNLLLLFKNLKMIIILIFLEINFYILEKKLKAKLYKCILIL